MNLYLARAGWCLVLSRDVLDPWLTSEADSTGAQPPADPQWDEVRRRSRWVNMAARHPLPWARCLQRSLALCLWLERLGVDPRLRIGVQWAGNELKAHAWVECRGEVVNDSPGVRERFAALRVDKARPPCMNDI